MTHLFDKNGEPYEIDSKDILANDVIFPHEPNRNRVGLWLIGHEFGPLVAVWASCEQDALDAMVDAGYDQFVVEDPEDDPEGDKYCYLGNHGAPCSLDYAWIKRIVFEPARDIAVMIAFAEAREGGHDNLGRLL